MAPTQDASVISGKSHAQDEAAELLSEAFFSLAGKSIGPIVCHLSINRLEEYALGLLVEAERDSVEDHLLTCDFCIQTLEKADRVIAFFKTVLILATAETRTAV